MTRSTVEYTRELVDRQGWLAAVIVQFVNLLGAFVFVDSATLQSVFLLASMTLVMLVAAQYTIVLAGDFLEEVDERV